MSLQTIFSNIFTLQQTTFLYKNICLFAGEVGKSEGRRRRITCISKLIFSVRPKYLAINPFYRKLKVCNIETSKVQCINLIKKSAVSNILFGHQTSFSNYSSLLVIAVNLTVPNL